MTFENNPILTDQLPQAAESPQERPHAKLLNASLIGSGIFVLFLLVGPILVAIFAPLLWVKLVVAGVWLVITGFVFLGTFMGFRRKTFSLRERDLTYRKGWLFHSITTVPFSRVQHCEVSQGPIERALGLASIKIFTAGGSSSDVSIPGLLPERARDMKSFILHRIGKQTDAQPDDRHA